MTNAQYFLINICKIILNICVYITLDIRYKYNIIYEMDFSECKSKKCWSKLWMEIKP